MISMAAPYRTVPISAGSSTRISARSLVIDLLSTMPPRHPVPVSALVRAAAILDVGENGLRVALTRLRAQGLVESDERGLYRLGAAAEPVNRHVRSWRTVEEDVGPWDGSWVAVEIGDRPRKDRAVLRRRTQALRLLGFEHFGATLCLRPNNLTGAVCAMRERLASLGIGPGALVFRLDDLDVEAERQARGLWEPAALEAGYAETCKRLAASAARLPSLSVEAGMAESFRVGGDAVRQIVLDPLLPDPIVAVDARRALVAAMRRYDRIGRRCWKAWAGESVELAQSPGDRYGLGVYAFGDTGRATG